MDVRDYDTRDSSFSRRVSPELCVVSSPRALQERGRREDREPAGTRGPPCGWHRRKGCTAAYGSSRDIPAFPARWLERPMSRSSRGAMHCCPRRCCGLVRCVGPVGRSASPHQLGASLRAPEPHDFAVRTSHRSSCAKIPLTARPPCETWIAPMRPASTAVRPASRDDRDTPLFLGPGRGDAYAISEFR